MNKKPSCYSSIISRKNSVIPCAFLRLCAAADGCASPLYLPPPLDSRRELHAGKPAAAAPLALPYLRGYLPKVSCVSGSLAAFLGSFSAFFLCGAESSAIFRGNFLKKNLEIWNIAAFLVAMVRAGVRREAMGGARRVQGAAA